MFTLKELQQISKALTFKVGITTPTEMVYAFELLRAIEEGDAGLVKHLLSSSGMERRLEKSEDGTMRLC